jgi:hypothetical protein
MNINTPASSLVVCCPPSAPGCAPESDCFQPASAACDPATGCCPPTKNLVYTVAFDAPGSESYRFLGKMLASSLVKTFFTGDILVFRNSPAPLYLVERKGLDEYYIDTPPMGGQEGARRAWCWKYKVADLIPNPEQYDKILFLDCDSLALRNLDHLLEGDWDIAYQPERGKPMSGPTYNAFLAAEEMAAANRREGANSGTLAVRGSRFREVMRRWQEIDESEPVRDTGFRDQASWNALLIRERMRAEREKEAAKEEGNAEDAPGPAGRAALPAALKLEPFPVGEVQFPGYLDPTYQSYSRAALTHNILPDTKEKIEFTFGLYMRTFYCDPTGLFFSMLEM